MTTIVDIAELTPRKTADLVADLVYVNYRHNRNISPNTTPEQWVKVYGPRTLEMEAVYQRERQADYAENSGHTNDEDVR